MKFFELFGELLLIYVLYKVVFDFIIPAYTTVKQVKSKMNDVQQRMHMQEQQRTTTTEPTTKASKVSKDDYIEFEEVK